MERNRYGFLLMLYKWKTLILLFPMLFVMEIGQLFYAKKNKILKTRKDIYKYWFNFKNLNLWLKKRKKMQFIRNHSRIYFSDSKILKEAVSEILFQEDSLKNNLLLNVGNPIMKIYHKIIVKIVNW
jgi:hypothetical protein